MNATKAKPLFLSLALALVGGSAALTPQPAQAIFCPQCATEWTQIMNNVELVMQYAKQVEQYQTQLQDLANQIQQYQNLVQNTKNLTNFQWGSAFQDLQKLNRMVYQGQNLAYNVANLDEMFKSKYPGYSSYASQNGGITNASAKLRQWSDDTNESIRETLAVAGLQASQFEGEDQTLRTLQQMSQSAGGRMEALQVGNQIASLKIG
ncbi:P-type conjugative transfer protein TrbJ, partial [Xanthomonas phaseoli]|uniref:P-type conjugative transfer protein TrbJ n=1 Tax=Xanthomonas phaseoli TaxID=1985254 RepID=UPI00035D24F4